MCGPGGSDIRGDPAEDVQARSSCICAEIRITLAAVADEGGPVRRKVVDGEATTAGQVVAARWPTLGHRLAGASSGRRPGPKVRP